MADAAVDRPGALAAVGQTPVAQLARRAAREDGVYLRGEVYA